MLDIVLRVISKYAQSHMYDIYAMLSGTIAYIIVMSIKIMYKKQLNKFLILVMSVIFGALIFVVASHISPQVYVDAHAGRGVGSILYAGGIQTRYGVFDEVCEKLVHGKVLWFTMFDEIHLIKRAKTLERFGILWFIVLLCLGALFYFGSPKRL